MKFSMKQIIWMLLLIGAVVLGIVAICSDYTSIKIVLWILSGVSLIASIIVGGNKSNKL